MKTKFKLIIALVFLASTISFTLAKCGTPQAIREFYQGKEARIQPDLALSFGSEHFLIHYDTAGTNAVYAADIDSNTIPDYVESTAVYSEYAWHIVVDSLGYRPPLPDSIELTNPDEYGGDTRMDVYLSAMALTHDAYGMTCHRVVINDGISRKATAYTIIQPDMTIFDNYSSNPYPALAVTCAHEFYHTVQFAYNYPESSGGMDEWWMEATAVFNEELCFDSVNDYYVYLPIFQNAPETPLFTYDDDENIWYGGVMLPIFLAEYFASDERRFSAEVLRLIWESCETTNPRQAIETFLADSGITMQQALQEFTLWRTRVDSFWHGGLFAEGKNYPLPDMHRVDLTGGEFYADDNLRALSCRLYQLPYEWKENGIVGEITDIDFGIEAWLQFIPIEAPGESMVNDTIGFLDEQLSIEGRWQYPSLIFVLMAYNCPAYADISIRIAETDSLAVELPEAHIFKNVYPNPCFGELTFEFDIGPPTNICIQIFNSAGEAVWDTTASYLFTGSAEINWNCRNYSGKTLATGVYVYIITAGEQHKQGKFLLISG